MNLYLHDSIKKYFCERKPLFDQVMDLRGECFRQQKGRLTQRITLGEKTYFIKQHTGVGWKEIIKNIFQCRLPVISAKNEWTAIQRLQTLNIAVPRLFGFGERGNNPATLQSFILMEELTPIISLETLCQSWQATPPTFALKRGLIEKVAYMARTLHENGITHRDFYICHFLLSTQQMINPKNLELYLIDLHRAQAWNVIPERWVIKDLAGLYFSSKDIGLTRRDLYRFMKVYRQQSLQKIMGLEKSFWQKVEKRGEQLYCDHTK